MDVGTLRAQGRHISVNVIEPGSRLLRSLARDVECPLVARADHGSGYHVPWLYISLTSTSDPFSS